MPSLADVLGNLMSEVTRARAQADLEAVRVAEAYAAHPLLKNFTVPRFRLPEITLDLPVIVNRIDTAQGEPPNFDAIRGAFQEVLELHLTKARIPKLVMRELSKVLDEVVKKVIPQGKNVNLLELADALCDAATSRLSVLSVLDADFESRLRAAVRTRFVSLRPSTTGIDVVVGTQELQQVAAPLITRFKLSVRENGVEWTTIEREDGAEARLVPE